MKKKMMTPEMNIELQYARMLRVHYTELTSGECSSKMLETKPEWTLLECLVFLWVSKQFLLKYSLEHFNTIFAELS